QKRLVIANSRKSGTLTITPRADGTIATSLFVLQNGRGPRVEAVQRLAADGTLAADTATGQHTMGTSVDEKVTLTAGKATWKSNEEAGERDVTAPAMYVPMAAAPDVLGTLVRAALQHGGKIALLPAGEVRVANVADTIVSQNGVTTKRASATSKM